MKKITNINLNYISLETKKRIEMYNLDVEIYNKNVEKYNAERIKWYLYYLEKEKDSIYSQYKINYLARNTSIKHSTKTLV